jgi:predicted protein tyrosine phosphatase
MTKKDDWSREKRWKDLYIRSTKLARAQQLGYDYPRISEKKIVQAEEMNRTTERLKVLFVCSRNQWRSPTAEQLWRKHPKLLTRSGGTSPNARHSVSIEDVRWADVIFVMEEKHKSRLAAEFTRLLTNKSIHVLDIPDEYKFMDPELIDMLEQSVNGILNLT